MSSRHAQDVESPVAEDSLTRGGLLRFVYSCPQAIIMTSATGSIRVLSAGAVALLVPYSSDGSLENVFAILEPYEPRFRDILREAIAGPGRRLDGLRVHMAAGPGRAARWFDVSAVPFDDGYSLSCYDVTKSVEAEAQYRVAVAEEALQRGKTETAVGVLHDLGNAITGLGGRTVEIRNQLSDTSVVQNLGRTATFLRPHEQALDAILGAGRGRALLGLLNSMASVAERTHRDLSMSLEKMNEYIAHAQELLSIQRAYATAGSDPMKGRVSAGRLLSDVQSMAGKSLEKRGGRLELAAPSGPLPMLRVDRSKLIQVLLNLVKNAAEAIDQRQGGDAPLVTLSAALRDDGTVAIRVRDNGAGFSAEQAQRLFEAGFSTKERGSGIGLSACRKIVESLGGRITLVSDGPGTGALAQIVLPREVVGDESK